MLIVSKRRNSIKCFRNQVIIIKRVSSFLFKHKVFFCGLIFLPIYHWLVINNAHLFKVDDITFSYFAVDYSMGFCDKFLVGELYHLLVGKYSITAVSSFVNAFYVGFILMLAFLLEKFALRFKQNGKATIILLCLFFTGPFSVGIFVKEFGMLDFFWAFLFVLAFIFLNQRFLRFLVPVLAALMVMVHYGAITCYLPALLLIIIFYSLKSESKSERLIYTLIFLFALLISVGLVFYFIKNNSSNLVYTAEEFVRILENQRHANSFYYGYVLYRYLPPEALSNPIFKNSFDASLISNGLANTTNIFELLYIQIKSTLTYTSLSKAAFVVAGSFLPLSLLIYVLFGFLKNKTKNIFNKILSCAFILLSMLILIIGCFLSTDTVRWCTHSVLLLLAFILTILYYDYTEGIERIERLFSKIGYEWILGFLFFYSNFIIEPYNLSL